MFTSPGLGEATEDNGFAMMKLSSSLECRSCGVVARRGGVSGGRITSFSLLSDTAGDAAGRTRTLSVVELGCLAL
jgi:hypothetical protein